MEIQIDPLASAVSVVALGVSIWAIIVAKRAPGRERIRAHRDIVRDALLKVGKEYTTAKFALSNGSSVGQPPAALSDARTALDTYGPRLPEYAELVTVWALIGATNDAWLRLSYEDERFEKGRETGLYPHPTERNALQATLRDAIKDARAKMDPYLNRMDAHDRRGEDPA